MQQECYLLRLCVIQLKCCSLGLKRRCNQAQNVIKSAEGKWKADTSETRALPRA